MAQSSAEEEGATSTPNITGEGKGVKRAPEEKQEHQERQGGQKHEEGEEAQEKGGPGKRAVSASTPPTKLAKPNPFDNAAAGSTSSSSSGGLAPGKGLEDRGAAEAQGRGAGSSDSEKVETEALRSLDLAVGTRLEVMWVLEDGDESVEKWWGCSVVGAKTGERDEAGGLPVFTLHYDAYQTFEEANHDVCFLDKYRLLHLEDGAEMTWKKEGEEVDREAVIASLAGEAIDLKEVMEAQEEEDADEGGESIETRGMRELAQLPHHQQMAMAAGYRRMADVVKEHLRAKMQQGGQDAVVSAADVDKMFRDVRAGVRGPGEV